MFVRGRRGAAVALAVVGLISTAACSGATQPKTLPPITSTPTPSASAKTGQDLTTAVAVVRTYFQLKDNLGVDMTTAAFEAIESASCACRRFLDSVRALHSRNERFFGTSHIRALTPVRDSASQVEVLALYDTTVGGTKDAAGRILFQERGHRGVEALFRLEFVDNSWRISDIATVKPGVAI